MNPPLHTLEAPGETEPVASAPAFEPTETVIEAARTRWLPDFRELWRYRELLFFLGWRDVKVRYKQTALGAAWAVLQPVIFMAVFTLFLGRIAKVPAGDLPYPLFVYAGLLPWFLFATAVGSAGNSLIDSERLITKVYFPRLIVPFAAAGAALVDFAVAFLVLVGLMTAYGKTPGWAVVLVPVVVGLIVVAALGAGSLLAALNVSYRDFRYVIPFLIQAWMFATPSIYLATAAPPADLPAAVRWALEANPMTGLIAFFRAALLDQPLPWAQLGPAAAVSLGLFVIGCLYFRRVEDSFADVI